MEWRRVEGFPYWVSEYGDVYSEHVNRALKPGPFPGGYLSYTLTNGENVVYRRAHQLVADAFLSPPRNGDRVVRHLDGNPKNNHFTNLSRGTHRDNNLDTVRHGRHNFAGRNECQSGHEYTDENTYYLRGRRSCRACKRARASKRRKDGALSEEDSRHGTINAYVNFGCRCPLCREANAEYARGRRKR